MNTTTPPKWAKVVIGIVLAAVLVAIWDFLAGKIFVAITTFNGDVKPDMGTIYHYWTWVRQHPEAHKIAMHLYGSMIGAGVACLAPIVIVIALGQKKRALYGEARWAKTSEIKEAGLLDGKGILVGSYKGKYLMLGGSQHVMMAAPTRSGKGVSVVIPNCLQWGDSMVVLDIKQENWNITSGFRAKHGQACYLFNPAAADHRSHRWNPLSYVSDDEALRIDDVQKIASFIYPDTPGTDPIWSASCRSLFLGIVLYLMETEGLPVTVGEVLRQAMTGKSKRFAKIIEAREEGEGGEPLSGPCVAALSDFLDTSDNTRTSIRKTFTSRLELWLNPIVDAATADNDFDLRELRTKRMSVYIGITPDNLARLAPIINLFLQQVIDLNTRTMPAPGSHKVLLLMDEFTSVGKLPVLQKGVAYIAGYGLRMLPIFQTPAQIKNPDLYGMEGARTLMDNHALRIVFAPKNYVDAEEISKDLGFTTVKSKSHSRPELFSGGTKSSSESDQRRELLLPQEIKDIGRNREIIFLENCKPIQCDKARYYADPVFMDRLKSVSRSLAGIGKRLPDEAELTQAATSGELAAPVHTLELKHERTKAERQAAMEVIASALADDGEPREVTAKDVAKLDEFDLSDFSMDFSGVDVPTEDLDDEALAKVAGEFYAACGAAT